MPASVRISSLPPVPPGSTLLQQLRGSGVDEVDCTGARLPLTVLSTLRQLPGLRLSGLSEDAARALQVLQLAEAFNIPGILRPLPFTVHAGDDGSLSLLPDRTANQSPLLGDPVAHAWTRGLLVTNLVLDLRHIEHVTSVLVAWLLQLATGIQPAPTRVLNPSPQAATQLRQLRLDHLMSIGA